MQIKPTNQPTNLLLRVKATSSVLTQLGILNAFPSFLLWCAHQGLSLTRSV